MDVVFFHMPKTAGTAVNLFFGANYPKDAMWMGRQRGVTPLAAMFNYLRLPDDQKDQFRFISAHMPLFMLEHLPQRFRAVTLLRNPLERAVSTYFHTMRSVGDPLAERWIKRGVSLEEFLVEQADWQMDNGQVRMLSGVEEAVPYGQCGPEHLAEAKRNLEERFVCHGLQERFEDTLFLFSQTLGLSEIHCEYANVAPNRPDGYKPTRAQRAMLMRHNSLDMELYAFAVELFSRRFDEVVQADTRAYDDFQSRLKAMGAA